MSSKSGRRVASRPPVPADLIGVTVFRMVEKYDRGGHPLYSGVWWYPRTRGNGRALHRVMQTCHHPQPIHAVSTALRRSRSRSLIKGSLAFACPIFPSPGSGLRLAVPLGLIPRFTPRRCQRRMQRSGTALDTKLALWHSAKRPHVAPLLAARKQRLILLTLRGRIFACAGLVPRFCSG